MSSKDEAARILDEGFPAELPGWDLTDDFLEDVGRFLDTSLHDPVPESGVGTVSQAPARTSADQTGLIETQLDNTVSPPVPADAASDLSHTQRRLHSNRLAQARARQRKKARADSMQSQLAETTAQLRALKLQQKQLEARNTLLEHVARINQGPMPSSQTAHNTIDSDLGQGNIDLAGLIDNTDKGPVIKLTAYGKQGRCMTIKEISNMSFEDLAAVHTAHARKLGQCLFEVATSTNTSRAEAEMQSCTMETHALNLCVAMGNPRSFSKFHSQRLDGLSGADNSHLSDTFYVEMLAAIDLTEPQQLDLMHLRRIFYGRLGQLLRERKQLLSKLRGDTSDLYRTIEAVPESTDIAPQLRDNGLAEYRAYCQFASAFFRGIFTCKQHAVSTVYSYPWIPVKHKMLEVLAAQRHQPSADRYLDGDGLEDLQHVVNWQQVSEYLKTLNAANLTQHVPLISCKRASTHPDTVKPAFPKTPFDLLI
ncbi:TPA: hypothetical protein ACH3X2_013375 [Trebouxia sp. C0005]|nr:MAG: hypothetical protein FRX49_13016 [Trebouxia sp. A1-2]